MTTLTGRRIIIAGGATGIGAATAERVAREGARVIVGDINLEGAEAVAARITAAGGAATAVRFDLASQESIAELHRRAMDDMGGIDGLFNVAADLRETGDQSPDNPYRDADLLEIDLAVWHRTFETNLLGYVRTCRAVLPGMIAQGHGVIVNTSSGAASDEHGTFTTPGCPSSNG